MWLLDQWAERHIIEAQRKGICLAVASRLFWMMILMCRRNFVRVIAYSRMRAVFPLNWSSAETLFSYLISSTVSGKMTLDTIRLVASSPCLN